MGEKGTHETAKKSGNIWHHLLLSAFVDGHFYVWEAMSACAFDLLLLTLTDSCAVKHLLITQGDVCASALCTLNFWLFGCFDIVC